MKKTFLTKIYFISLLLLPCCYNQTQNNNMEKHSLFIQTLPQSTTLTTIIKSISKQINDIIKEEIGLSENYDFNFFLPKQTLRLTVYYINDIHENKNNLILSTLDAIPFHAINSAHIRSKVEFFEGQLEEKDELVVMINDNNNELKELNNTLKKILHKANKQNNYSLYNQNTSEKNDYIPHIGLGRIRTTSIKNHLQDASQFTQKFAIIQKKIKNFVESFIENYINQNSSNLLIDKVCIFDLQKRSCIKEYSLTE